jgi:hypothetical protein
MFKMNLGKTDFLKDLFSDLTLYKRICDETYHCTIQDAYEWLRENGIYFRNMIMNIYMKIKLLFMRHFFNLFKNSRKFYAEIHEY